jgi:hypothetical protein
MRIHSTNCSRHSNSDGQTQQQSCSPSTSPSLCHEGELEAVKGLVELAGIFAAERETWTHGENQESMPESGGNPNTNSARKRSESAGRTSRRKQPAEADSASVGQSTVGRASGPKSGSKPAPAKAAAPAGACFVYVVMSVCSCFSVRMCTCACQGFWCVLVYVCLCMLFSFCMCAEGCLCAHVNFVCIWLFVSVHMRVCVLKEISMRRSLWILEFLRIPWYVCVYVCVCVCVCVCVHICKYTYIHTNIHTHVFVCICICRCMCVYICMYTYAYMYSGSKWCFLGDVTSWRHTHSQV